MVSNIVPESMSSFYMRPDRTPSPFEAVSANPCIRQITDRWPDRQAHPMGDISSASYRAPPSPVSGVGGISVDKRLYPTQAVALKRL